MTDRSVAEWSLSLSLGAESKDFAGVHAGRERRGFSREIPDFR